MYSWRKLKPEQRAEVLQYRKDRGVAWHSPPHFEFKGLTSFIISAACFEHRHVVGKNPERMLEFQESLLKACADAQASIDAWCLLPNHYHLLTQTEQIRELRKQLGLLHGRTARRWNMEDATPGRKVWFNFFDRDMKSERHRWATLNYIHNNAVHHGYVEKWQDWPYSSAHEYLTQVGKEEAARVWRQYPVLDYGKDWDVY